MSRWAVVLAGGVGSRFWPLSTPSRPKQLLPLVTDEPLLARRGRAAAPDRATERDADTHERRVGAGDRRAAARRSRARTSSPSREPAARRRRSTWAAQEIARRDGPDAMMISVHADWAVGDAVGLSARARASAREVAERASRACDGRRRPDAGRPGLRLHPARRASSSGGVRRVARFVEKPDRARAEEMRRDGYLWNSGIFVWRVGDFLDEVRALHAGGRARAARVTRDDIRSVLRRRHARSRSTSACSSAATASSSCRAISAGTTSAPGARCARPARTTQRAMRCTAHVHAVDRATTSCTRRDRRSCSTVCRDLVVVVRDGLDAGDDGRSVERFENAHGRSCRAASASRQ